MDGGKSEVICNCIYCGSDNIVAFDGSTGYSGDLWHIYCGDCLANSPEAGSKERAIAEWNKLHIIVNKRIQELEDENKRILGLYDE